MYIKMEIKAENKEAMKETEMYLEHSITFNIVYKLTSAKLTKHKDGKYTQIRIYEKKQRNQGIRC